MAGVPYDAHYNVTTVDPPELVRFIRHEYPDVAFNKPKHSMRQLIIRHQFPPTRRIRYCCQELKECHGQGRIVVTGVRWAESNNRRNHSGVAIVKGNVRGVADENGAEYSVPKQGGIVLNDDNDASRRTVEQCYRTHKTLVNPIIDWTDEDIWEFMRVENIPYCGLYDEGWKRLGCVGCPMGGAKNQIRQFERWPVLRKVYLNAFEKMLEARREAGKQNAMWPDAEAVMERWLEEPRPGQADGQMSIADFEWDA